MKFVCERCHTRYSIADEKVRQKILKIRCKTCENVIVVRESGPGVGALPASSATSPPRPPAAAPAPPPARAKAEWHVAHNGNQAGPLTLADAARKALAAKPGDELYVWKESFDGWKDPSEVPPLVQEMNAQRARVAPAPPPPPLRRPTGAQPLTSGAPAASTRASASGAGMSTRAPTPALGAGASARPSALGTGSAMAPSARAPTPALGGGMSARSVSAPPGSRLPTPAPRAAAAPVAIPQLDGFDEQDERTQIQPLDASLLVDAPNRPAVSEAPAFTGAPAAGAAFGASLFDAPPQAQAPSEAPLPFFPTGEPQMSAAPSSFFPAAAQQTPAAPFFPTGAPQAPAAPSPFFPTGAIAPPAEPASGLSKLTSPGRGRAVKLAAAAAALVLLLILGVVFTMKKPADQPVAVAAPAPAAAAEPAKPVDVEAQARAEAEERFRRVVDVAPPPTAGKSAPRRAQGMAKGTSKVAPGVAPPPVDPGALRPGDDLASRRFAAGSERQVARYNASASKSNAPEVTQPQISAVVKKKENQDAIKSCYERALKRDERLKQGRVEVTVSIGSSGIVKNVFLRAPPEFSTVEPCIKQAVRRWAFPQSSEEYATNFPLIFQGNL